jgi:WD repeat-containing protein 59
MLERVRRILEQDRPCLEPALRFLLYADANEPHAAFHSESSSEDDDVPLRRSKHMGISVMRHSKNLAEPRTSQGTFSVGGEQ